MKKIITLIFCAALLALPLVSCQGVHTDWDEYLNQPDPEPEPSPDTLSGANKALALYFTGTWCTYCPNMSKTLKAVNEKLDGRLIIVSIHKGDRYSLGFEDDFCKEFSVSSFPSAIFNFEPTVFTNNEDIICEAVSRHLEEVKNPCQISAVKDPDVPGTVNVSVEIRESGKYRIFAALMQDGLVGYQVGQGDDYVSDNVIRELATSPYGDELDAGDGGRTISAGTTVSWTGAAGYEDLQDCYWTLAVLKEDSDGRYVVNNAVRMN